MQEEIKTNLQALINTAIRQIHACIPYLNFYFTWSIFVCAFPKFGLLPKPNDSMLSFSKDLNLKLEEKNLLIYLVEKGVIIWMKNSK